MEKLESIWMDGALVPWDQANVHVLTHALHYGTGAFEGIRSYEKADGRAAIFRLRDHVRRLFDSGRVLGLEVPFSFDAIVDGCLQTLAANGLRAGYLRPLLFIGDGVMGIHPADCPTRLVIAAWKWGRYLGDAALTKGIRVKVSSFCRPHPNSQMTIAKSSGGYVTGVLASREARALGFDEALLLDVEGYVAEGPGQNLFIVRRGRLKTPPLGHILPGITRDTVLAFARDLGIDAVEQRLTRDEVYCADEVFFCGTAVEITPIRELDGRVVGTGAPGPVTRRIQDLYFRTAEGREPRYRDWLEFVGSEVIARR